MDKCEQFYLDNKDYFEMVLQCESSYGRGFLIFRKGGETLVQFKISEMPLYQETARFIIMVTQAVKEGKIRL